MEWSSLKLKCEDIKQQFESDHTKIDFIRTEMPTLNNILGGGLRTSEFILFSGLQGKGKTTFLLRELINGIEQGKKVCYICFEENPTMIWVRICCYYNRIKYISHKIEEYDPADQKAILNTPLDLSNLKIIYFYDYYQDYMKYCNEVSVVPTQRGAIINLIEQCSKCEYKFIFIDYLAKIRGNTDNGTNDFFAELAENIKVLVDKHNICVITSMQMNRMVYSKFKEKNFDPSDINQEFLQKSVEVGANVTQAISMFPDPLNKDVRIFNIYKNRLNGQEGVIYTTLSNTGFEPLYTRVEIEHKGDRL